MENNIKSLIWLFVLLIFQSFFIFTVYYFMPEFTTHLDTVYQRPGGVWLIFLILLLYFIPSFIAIASKHKYFLQITLLNIFLGFSILGWVGALIWATIKTPVMNKQNYTICNILIQIFSFIMLFSYCVIDHNLHNYQRMDAIYNQNIQETLEAIKTIQTIKHIPGGNY